MYDRPFRWWVQSVMPLVFDDSLSYYEVLAKLTKYIEGLTGDVEQIEKILGTIEGIEDITQFTEFLERIQAEIGNLENLQTDTKANLVSAINEVALKADIAYWKPPTGIPESDLSQEVRDKLNKTGEATKYIINNKELKPAPSNNSPADLGLGTYSVPSGGIPWDTLSQDVKDRINAGGGGTGGTSDYTELINKPQINGHTLNAGNNTSEDLGLGTYNKPDGGIPESDLSAEVQEKLNTSGGIADSQQTFVASRDYEAGELVYINGVLYRTKYKIIAGTNMIPGNNIEVTDISSELEKINSDIDALQSGAGPDSWNLTTTVQSFSHLEKVDFFEYFNCIGGESYNFIVEPVDPSTAVSYTLDIRKKDGTVASRHAVTNTADYMNRLRFTFVPEDSGEYYCTFYRNASGFSEGISACKVTIEYTQSQGISELWSQVNAAAELEPRVTAVETLVGQQQTQLSGLNGIPEKVNTIESESKNLLQQIIDGNAYNIIGGKTISSGTAAGITWTQNDDGSVTAIGENASKTSARAIAGANNAMPDEVSAGDVLYVIHSSEKVKLNFVSYLDGTQISTVSFLENGVYTVPENATGLIIRYLINKDTSNVYETVRPIVLNEQSNEMLKTSIDTLRNELDSAENNVLQLNATNKDWIPMNSDLNTYTTAGQWLIPSAAGASSLLHRPKDFASTGILNVLNTHNTNHVYQIIFANSGTNIWARHIRIRENIFDEWLNLVSAQTGEYTWQKEGFIIHNPDEEQADMISVVKEILDINITDVRDWTKADSNGDRIIPANKIYEMWDYLQSKYPEYIDAGEVIGSSYDTAGNVYSQIKAYYVHPRNKYTSWYGNVINIPYQNLPTVYLSAGTHGGESSPTWNLFEIFRRAFLTGTIYSAFLEGVQFRVIPVLDIWSYDHLKRYLAAAYDANGDPKPEAVDSGGNILDIYDGNRQCICSDMNSPSYNNLTIQSFAGEATAITNYFQSHNFGSVNGDCYIDLHNCSYSLGYLTTDKNNIANDFNIMIDTLAKDWMANTTFANGDKVDYYASSTTDHTKQRGTILANESIEKSYAWFFEKAYSSYSSNILEVQQADPTFANSYSFAKGLDITYRWFKRLFNKIKTLT